MSLRDQLIAKGLVSKKRAQRLDREAKRDRKARQASKKKRKNAEAEKAAAAKREAEAREKARRDARDQAASQREAHELRFRIRDLVRSRRMAGRGPVPFHFRMPQTTRIGCLMLSDTLARDLRSGRSAIAGYLGHEGPEWMVVPRATAEKLMELGPEWVAHLVPDKSHLDDPSQSVMHRTWESALGPHRVRDQAELSRRLETERARSTG